jgi:hypothetical protein
MMALILSLYPSNAADETANDPTVGRWRMNFKKQSDCVLVLNPDGSFKISRPGLLEKGRWVCLNPKSTPRKYELSYSGGRKVEEYYLTASGKELSRIKNKGGSTPVGERIK